MSIDKRVIKEQLSLPAVVSFYTGQPIPRDGFILCPFHNDHNPSMKIYNDHYKCYSIGCDHHGDVIHWVEEWEQVDFQTALQICNELLLNSH